MSASNPTPADDRGITWITSPSQVDAASDASLVRSLLTGDGAGVKVKRAALVALVNRAYDSPSAVLSCITSST